MTYYLICPLTPAGKVTNKLSARIFLKMAERSEAKRREAKFRVKNQNLRYFEAKLRFAPFALLRSAFFSEIQVDNLLVTLPARVKFCLLWLSEAKLCVKN